MPKKFKGANSKAVEANERKAAVKKAAEEQKQKQKEDAKWVDDDKIIAAKEARKKEAEEKRLQSLQRKNEIRAMEEKEREELTKKYGNKGQAKITKAEIERTKQREIAERQREEAKKKKEELEIPLEENINQIMRAEDLKLAALGEENAHVNARSVEEALEQLGGSEIDKNPEKRLRAAFSAYESVQLPILREENPSLKLSQVKEMLWKQWQKAPENPLNQQ